MRPWRDSMPATRGRARRQDAPSAKMAMDLLTWRARRDSNPRSVSGERRSRNWPRLVAGNSGEGIRVERLPTSKRRQAVAFGLGRTLVNGLHASNGTHRSIDRTQAFARSPATRRREQWPGEPSSLAARDGHALSPDRRLVLEPCRMMKLTSVLPAMLLRPTRE